MCIAIYKPANETISEETLLNCYNANGDGCGFAYINTDNKGVKKIIIKKTMEWETFLRQYKRAIRVAPDSDFLIHFRIRTHGETSTLNCHPFRIDEETVFIHNGIVPKQRYDQRLSDTQMFNIDYLQELPKGFMFNQAINNMLEDFIGFSKLVLMDIDMNVTIYNEQKGEKVGGIWYSNGSYKTPAFRRPSYPATRYKANNYSKKTTSAGVININDKRALTVKSYVPCSNCKKWNDPIEKMDFYYHSDSVLGYCRQCATKFSEMPMATPSHYKVTSQCYLDYRNDMSVIGIGNKRTFFQTWINPWGPFDSIDQEIDQEELNEYYAGLSREA